MSDDPLNMNLNQSYSVEVQHNAQDKMAGWNDLSKDHALYRFGGELKAVLDEAAHDEMYGVKLVAPEEG